MRGGRAPQLRSGGASKGEERREGEVTFSFTLATVCLHTRSHLAPLAASSSERMLRHATRLLDRGAWSTGGSGGASSFLRAASGGGGSGGSGEAPDAPPTPSSSATPTPRPRGRPRKAVTAAADSADARCVEKKNENLRQKKDTTTGRSAPSLPLNLLPSSMASIHPSTHTHTAPHPPSPASPTRPTHPRHRPPPSPPASSTMSPPWPACQTSATQRGMGRRPARPCRPPGRRAVSGRCARSWPRG